MTQEWPRGRLFIFCGGFGAKLLHNMKYISPSGVLCRSAWYSCNRLGYTLAELHTQRRQSAAQVKKV